MCDVASAGLALSAVSTAMGAYGMYQQGQQQKAQAEYQSAIANNNAIRAEYMAQDALQRGQLAEQQQRLRGRLLIGQMRAAQASSGVDINQGSAVDLQESQAGVNELDALTVRNNFEREAQNYRIQASGFTSQADLYGYAGNNASSNAAWGAAGTVLGGAGTVALKWYSVYGPNSSSSLGPYNGGFTRNPGGIDAQ